MKQTVVPNRNMIMLAVAAGWAISRKAERVAYAAHRGDHTIYPDCRPEFVAAFSTMANFATKAGVEGDSFKIHTPLIAMTKAEIVREAARLGLDAAMSWSCYDPTSDLKHCGLCDSCRLRARGFAEAGLPDPTDYATLGDGGA